MWVLLRPPRFEEQKMQAITTIGLDIAKSVFQVHGVDAEGNVVFRRQLKRRYVLAFFQKLPSCLVGIEACACSHHWSRELQALGHTVRLMPPAYVKTYVKRHKNDATDAEAICEAVTRANMRFVATKTPEQQSCLTLHRTRHLFIRQQTSVINAIRLDSAGLRRVAAEGVPETVIAAIYLLHERSVDEIASKLRPDNEPCRTRTSAEIAGGVGGCARGLRRPVCSRATKRDPDIKNCGYGRNVTLLRRNAIYYWSCKAETGGTPSPDTPAALSLEACVEATTSDAPSI
jgi:transposase